MKILIVKTSAIGDVIQAFPVVAYIKKKMPEAVIDWVVEQGIAELVAAHPDVHQAIPVDTKKWRKTLFQVETWRALKQLRQTLRETSYDLLIDLQGNSKSALFTWMAKSREKVGYDFKSLPEKLNYLATFKRFSVSLGMSIQQQYLHLVQSYFGEVWEPSEPVHLKAELPALSLQKPVLMVCFGSRWTNKKLPQETMVQLLKRATSFSFLFIFSNEEEKKEAKEFQSHFPENSQILGGLTLPQLQKLMHRVNGVISMDSATLHLCGTTATPSFSVFGPSSAHVYKPFGTDHFAVQGSCPYGRKFVKRCPILRSCPTGACIKELSADTLFQTFENFLSRCLIDSFVSPNSCSSGNSSISSNVHQRNS